MLKTVPFAKSTFAALAMSWAALSYAQAKTAPGFGDELAEMSAYVWALVIGFAVWGILCRICIDIGRKRLELKFGPIFTAILVGLLSSVVAFGLCEWVKVRGITSIPDVLQCGLIALAGFNNRALLDAVAKKLGSSIRTAEVSK